MYTTGNSLFPSSKDLNTSTKNLVHSFMVPVRLQNITKDQPPTYGKTLFYIIGLFKLSAQVSWNWKKTTIPSFNNMFNLTKQGNGIWNKTCLAGCRIANLLANLPNSYTNSPNQIKHFPYLFLANSLPHQNTKDFYEFLKLILIAMKSFKNAFLKKIKCPFWF